MLHLAIGVLGILAVVILAVEGVLDAAAAAILSSIVAYSVGASGSRSSQSGDAGSAQPASPQAAVVPLPDGQVNTPYQAATIKLPGRTPPYHLYWVPGPGGGLPPGLQFNGDTGVVSGTPTQAGSFTFLVCPGDRPQGAVLGSFEVTVAAA